MSFKERFFKATHEKNALQRHMARRYLFGPLEKLGLHLTGDHFYEIIPNTGLVERTYSEEPRHLPGIDWRFTQAEQFALSLVTSFGQDYARNATRHGFREKNYYFRGLDALFLFLMLRQVKPRKLVEVGQGFSTRIALAALEQNAAETGIRPTFVSVDPYPRFSGKDAPANVALQLVEKSVQELTLEPLLAGCDFLFIDSSHVYKFGSDVAFEFTALYPRLPANAVLHLHDIFTPYEYPKDWILKERRFWNEQYFLECFLMFNPAFELYLPLHLLTRQSQLLLSAVRALPLDPKFKFAGSSCYLRRRDESHQSHP